MEQKGDLPGLARTYWRHRCTILFYTLIVTMVGGSTDFQHPKLQWNAYRVIVLRLPTRSNIASWRGEKPPLSADGHRCCLASAYADSLT